jgi:hypothetical protein
MAKKRKAVKKSKKAAKKKNPAKRKKKATKRKAAKKRSRKPSNKKRSIPKGTAKTAGAAPKAKTKRGRRYSAKRQATLLDKYHELRKGGMVADKAAKKVGVSYLTLLKWEKKTGKRIKSKRGRPAGKKSLFKKSALKKALKVPKKKRGRPAKKPEGLTLVTPSGFRIEGISSSELVRVLKSMK